ncbi:MAG: DNA mismatch repair protein MutT [Alphaproteobacteria bacterium]|nr:MAG: DNA mismatch repair protein MutT [Alphaproteobacteria bacterium]
MTATAGPVRPVDAAGLVLIRAGRRGPEVLLGRRHRRVAFLPDIYVFPGGRLDREDGRPSGFPEPAWPGLTPRLGGRRSPAAFLRAALRETLEETGLMVGLPAAAPPAPAALPEPWRSFAERGLAPAFGALSYVGRAITPTTSHRRYHTRFFLADGGTAKGELGGSGELEDLRWFPVAETARLGLVDVTQVVLAEALRRWLQTIPADAPAPLLTYRRDVVQVRRAGRPPLVGDEAVLGAAALDEDLSGTPGRQAVDGT